MPEFIPRPNLPTGLAEQSVNLRAHMDDPWANLAKSLGDTIATGIKDHIERQPFSKEDIAAMNKGGIPESLPKKQYLEQKDSKNKLDAAADNLGARLSEERLRDSNKQDFMKQFEDIKAGHAKELQNSKNETARAVAEGKAEATRSLAEARAQHAKQIADERNRTQQVIAQLKISDPAAAAKFAEIAEKAQGTVTGKVKDMLGLGPKFVPPSSVMPKPAAIPAGRVAVQDKNGNRHTVPQEQLEQAKAQGYTVIPQ